MSGRSRDLALFQDLIEQFTVLGCIDIFSCGSQDRNTHLHQGLSQLDRGLSAELNDSSVRFLDANNALDIFRGQRLEIQLICDIEVGTYGLRVVVYNNSLVSFFFKRPGAVHGTEVELDTLANADRAGAENQNFFLLVLLFHLADAVEAGIVIRSLRCELSCTGIYHLICCADVVCMAHGLDFFLAHTGQSGNDIVRELDALCFF